MWSKLTFRVVRDGILENGPLCDYDLGDCCLRWNADPDIDECVNCRCHLGQTFFFTEEFREEIFGPK